MPRPARLLARAAWSGTVASVTSSLALAALARRGGKGALQPVNATSHWLNGAPAASFKGADLGHTAVGYATHHAATIFWAVLFERWRAPAPPTAKALFCDAIAVSTVAAIVDYQFTPRRFTPGWEFVLSTRAMAGAYAAMAAGLAGAALLSRR